MDASIVECHADLADEEFFMIKVTRSFATLQYKLSTIDIAIKAPIGDDIVLNSLSANTTIGCIKHLISKQENLPKKYIILRTESDVLANDTLLRTILANDPSQIVLELAPMRIEIRSLSAKFGTTFGEISVPITTTIPAVKTIIKDQLNVHVERLVLADGLRICELHDVEKVDDDQSGSEEEAKQPLGDIEEEEDDDNNSTEEGNDGFIRDLLSYGIEDGDTIYFSCKRDRVFMFWSYVGSAQDEELYQLLPFELCPQDQIKDLKHDLLCSHHIDPQRHHIVLADNGKLYEKLDDEDYVQDYDLAKFHVVEDIAIFISGLNDKYVIFCPDFSKGSEIKAMVYRDKQIDAASQILLFNGKELKDDDRLNECGIKHGSEIQLQVEEATPALSASDSIATRITDVHDQQNNETCWAFALATVFRACVHKSGNIRSPHKSVVSELVRRYGKGGVDVQAVLRKECPRSQLCYRVISEADAAEAFLRKNTVLLATFHLDQVQWKRFCAFFSNERSKSFAITNGYIGKPNGSKVEGHAVAMYQDGGNYWKIKNSWGAQWGDGGFCKIGKNAIDDFKIFHVFYQDKQYATKGRVLTSRVQNA
eukprot:368761_1